MLCEHRYGELIRQPLGDWTDHRMASCAYLMPGLGVEVDLARSNATRSPSGHLVSPQG
jgi:hypothetical protein